MTSKVRVADVVARLLVEAGIVDVFLVTGGGAMHLNDAIGRTSGLRWHCCHHEQACAMAAESYFRASNKLAAVNVTTGPGGTNAITGVFGAWTDSLGMVVISGNVKWETCVGSTGLPLRQLGDQELDIIKLVAPITKYAVMVTDPMDIKYHINRAIHLARSGRPGPTWVDVPMNVQGALVDEASLRDYDPGEDAPRWETPDLAAAVDDVVARLRRAQRPMIMLGNGVRIAGAHAAFLELLDRLKIPTVTPFNGHDLLWDDHESACGRQGIIGDRPGNFTIQNSDLVLSIGARLSIRQVSYAWETFARAAELVVVDADAAELKKPTLKPALGIHADAADFIDQLLKKTTDWQRPAAHQEYLSWCKERVRLYPVVTAAHAVSSQLVNPYWFVSRLSDALAPDDVIVCADGTACVVTFQALRLQAGQRLWHNSGAAPMGYELPAALGAHWALGRRRTICMAGDGSIMMNLQELQTIVHHQIPVKIFLFNNDGYHSIRQTQKAYFADNPIGYDPASGVSLPDFAKVCAAFGIGFRRVADHAGLDDAIGEALALPGPQLCEVMIDPAQGFAPRSSSRRLADGRMVSAPLEDLAPFLPRDELQANMLIPLLDQGDDR